MKTFVVEIADAAATDARKAFLWYEDKSAALGLRFESDFKQIIERLKENPEAFQVRYTKVRVAFLENFPFGIHYFVKGNIVVVLAVFHTSLSTEHWKKRSK